MTENKTTNKSGFATTSLVLGILGVCTSFIPIINNASFVLGLIGFIFAIIALAKKSSKGKAITGIIFCVLAIVMTISYQQSLSESLNEVSKDLAKISGDSTEEVLKDDVDVTLENFEVEEDEYGFIKTQLKVHVKNKTSEKKSFNIQIEAVDGKGTRIETDYIYANSLTAGQSQEFKVFEYVENEKIDAMKNATFQIVEASVY